MVMLIFIFLVTGECGSSVSLYVARVYRSPLKSMAGLAVQHGR